MPDTVAIDSPTKNAWTQTSISALLNCDNCKVLRRTNRSIRIGLARAKRLLQLYTTNKGTSYIL